MFPGPSEEADSVLRDAEDPGGPASSDQAQLLEDEPTVARAEREGEHHVAEHQTPAGHEHPSHLAQRKFLSRVIQVVKGIVGHGEADRFVRERQAAQIGHERLDIPQLGRGCLLRKAVEHRRRDVDGGDGPNGGRERKREESRSSSEVDDVVLRARVSKRADEIRDVSKRRCSSDCFPALDAIVPDGAFGGGIRSLQLDDLVKRDMR